jgi:hypothetical protein
LQAMRSAAEGGSQKPQPGFVVLAAKSRRSEPTSA